jgi:Flp pilus assembly protein TadG
MNTPLRRKSERGNAVLEFALGWALLWSLFAGVYQIGYGFYVYNVLLTSVANAAELGSKLGYDTGSTSSYTTSIKNMVVYGDTATGTKALVPNLTTSNVNVNVSLDSAGMPRDVTVTITGYTINALFMSYALNNKPRATTLYYGQISCSTCT